MPIRFQLLKTGETENETMKGRQENGSWRDLGGDAGIGESRGGGTEIKNLVEIAVEGSDLVVQVILPSHKCKILAGYR